MSQDPPPLGVGDEVEYVGPPLPVAGVSPGDVGRVVSAAGGQAGVPWSCVVEFDGGVRLVVDRSTAGRYRKK